MTPIPRISKRASHALHLSKAQAELLLQKVRRERQRRDAVRAIREEDDPPFITKCRAAIETYDEKRGALNRAEYQKLRDQQEAIEEVILFDSPEAARAAVNKYLKGD